MLMDFWGLLFVMYYPKITSTTKKWNVLPKFRQYCEILPNSKKIFLQMESGVWIQSHS